MKRNVLYLVIFAVAAAGAASGSYLMNRKPAPTVPALAPSPQADAIGAELRQVLATYRKMIVLTQGDEGLPASARAEIHRVGQELFHANQERIARTDDRLAALLGSNNPRRFDAVGACSITSSRATACTMRTGWRSVN